MFKSSLILQKVRERTPLIHHLTNYVTMGDCADATMSIGALPVMAEAEEEVEEMVESARAVVLNTGTLTTIRLKAMLKLARKAKEQNIPVVLDPVGVGATSFRARAVEKILDRETPAIIKGNQAEIRFLAGGGDAATSGIHSFAAGGDSLADSCMLRDMLGVPVVVGATGAVDVVSDGKRTARIYNGHPMLPLIIGSGCMAGSLVAAFAAVESDYFYAVASALATMGVAGEIAAERLESGRSGPAAFKKMLLDALYWLEPAELDRRARIEIQW